MIYGVEMNFATKQTDDDSTAYWLEFRDYEAAAKKRFLGVAILDDRDGTKTVAELVEEASRLGINPGGEVMVDELPGDAIADDYKWQLITDRELVVQLEKIAGVCGNNRLMEKQYDAILAHFDEEAAERANCGWGGGDITDEHVSLVTKIYTIPRHVITSESHAPFTMFKHTIELYGGPTFLSEPLNGTPIPFVDITGSRLSKYGISEYHGPCTADHIRILTYDGGWLRVHELEESRVQFETPESPSELSGADPGEAILHAISTEFGVEIVREGDDRFGCWVAEGETLGSEEDDPDEASIDIEALEQRIPSPKRTAGVPSTGAEVIPLKRKH
jgi:hypothetical protein